MHNSTWTNLPSHLHNQVMWQLCVISRIRQNPLPEAQWAYLTYLIRNIWLKEDVLSPPPLHSPPRGRKVNCNFILVSNLTPRGALFCFICSKETKKAIWEGFSFPIPETSGSSRALLCMVAIDIPECDSPGESHWGHLWLLPLFCSLLSISNSFSPLFSAIISVSLA